MRNGITDMKWEGTGLNVLQDAVPAFTQRDREKPSEEHVTAVGLTTFKQCTTQI